MTDDITGSFTIGEKEGTRNQLAGRFSFIDQLEFYNNHHHLIKNKNHDSSSLTSREREYRSFLFYTQFLNNLKPLIKIGNNYRIRHHETDKVDITDDNYYDYFFNRCLSLIALAIKYLQ